MNEQEKKALGAKYKWESIHASWCGFIAVTVAQFGEAWVYGYWIGLNADYYVSEPASTGWRFHSQAAARKAVIDAVCHKLDEIAANEKWEIDQIAAKEMKAAIKKQVA